MVTMLQALKNIGASRLTGQVNQQLTSMFPFAKGQTAMNVLLEYCWLVYSKAKNASGPQLIGRTNDLWVPAYLLKAGITDKDKQLLWDSCTKGNIEKIDLWSVTVNDCWVLGGVHRQADFELVSIRTPQNLWDFANHYYVVTAREMMGLLHFGYRFDQKPGRLFLVCRDDPAGVQKARNATIEDYDAYMKKMQAKGPDSIRSVIAPEIQALHSEIQSFDRSRLKHVTAPR
jgi:hypothetical protein